MPAPPFPLTPILAPLVPYTVAGTGTGPFTQGDYLLMQFLENFAAQNHEDLLAGQAAAHADAVIAHADALVAHADSLAHVAAMNANHAALTLQLTTQHNALVALLTAHHVELLAQLAAFQLSMETHLQAIFDKLEEIRVFHQRYIKERRLPRVSAASILLSELFGNENLDDDSENAIYGKDFVLDPEDPSTPSIIGGASTLDEFGESIFPINPTAPIKTWQEYLDTIEEESYHA